jgi:hypothetical protein
MAGRPVLRFLMDNNVPDSVGTYLRGRRHSVVRLRTIMPMNSPDQIVAEAAIRDQRILVSWDKDFNAQRFKQPRFDQLSRIGFSCPEPLGVARLRSVIELVEFEWQAKLKRRLPRMILHIGSDQVRTRR